MMVKVKDRDKIKKSAKLDKFDDYFTTHIYDLETRELLWLAACEWKPTLTNRLASPNFDMIHVVGGDVRAALNARGLDLQNAADLEREGG